MVRSSRLRARASELRNLARHHQACDAGRRKSSKNTRAQRRKGQGGYVSGSGGRELAEDTNLNTQRANVSESAESVGGDELGSRGQVGVVFVLGQESESVVLVLWRRVIRHNFFKENAYV